MIIYSFDLLFHQLIVWSVGWLVLSTPCFNWNDNTKEILSILSIVMVITFPFFAFEQKKTFELSRLGSKIWKLKFFRIKKKINNPNLLDFECFSFHHFLFAKDFYQKNKTTKKLIENFQLQSISHHHFKSTQKLIRRENLRFLFLLFFECCFFELIKKKFQMKIIFKTSF